MIKFSQARTDTSLIAVILMIAIACNNDRNCSQGNQKEYSLKAITHSGFVTSLSLPIAIAISGWLCNSATFAYFLLSSTVLLTDSEFREALFWLVRKLHLIL